MYLCTYVCLYVCRYAGYPGTYVGVLVCECSVCMYACTYLCESVGCSAQQMFIAGGWCAELGGALQLRRAFYTAMQHPDKI